MPEVDDNIDIEIEDKDIRIDTYRASGAGGQHVNKTESAIRITHIKTNVVVQCQNDRSQHKNKPSAMKMLKSRLYELELEKQMAEKNGISKSEIGWGHQIRSYVMQPYQQVKDTRSNIGYSNVDAILDGDIDKMIENQKHLNNIPFINEEVALESTDGLKKLNKKLNRRQLNKLVPIFFVKILIYYFYE